MIEVSKVPFLPERGHISYMCIGDRRYRILTRPCAKTGMAGPCEHVKTIICFHGFSQSSTTWDNLYLPGYVVIGIDLLGHGGSSPSPNVGDYAFDSILADLHSVIKAHVAGDYALLGYSQGARLALLYALRYGAEISKLVLESGSVGIQDPKDRAERQHKDEALALEIEEKGIVWFEKTWSQVPIFASQAALPDSVREGIKRRRLQNHPRGLAHTLRGLGQGCMPYVGERIQDLTMPYLYIAGALDHKYSAIGKAYFSKNCHILPGVGHTVHLEAPEDYNRLVYQFLEDL